MEQYTSVTHPTTSRGALILMSKQKGDKSDVKQDRQTIDIKTYGDKKDMKTH